MLVVSHFVAVWRPESSVTLWPCFRNVHSAVRTVAFNLSSTRSGPTSSRTASWTSALVHARFSDSSTSSTMARTGRPYRPGFTPGVRVASRALDPLSSLTVVGPSTQWSCCCSTPSSTSALRIFLRSAVSEATCCWTTCSRSRRYSMASASSSPMRLTIHQVGTRCTGRGRSNHIDGTQAP